MELLQRSFRLPLLLFLIVAAAPSYLISPAAANLVLNRVDRRVDLTSQIVRIASSLKVENAGTDDVSEILFSLSTEHAEKVAFLQAVLVEGKSKSKSKSTALILTVTSGSSNGRVMLFSVALPKPLKGGESLSLETYVVLTHVLKPFPEEIGQSDAQLVLFHESAYFLSPYPVKVQSTTFKLPNSRVESYSKVGVTKLVDSEVRYGPYENVEPLATAPITLHFENNQPFAAVEELVREIEISHWGNIYVTENYKLSHGGARHKGSFSRFDYQSRPAQSGAASFRHLLARLPPRAHSVYYRDEIGNISTSHLRSDFKKTELELEPRYPLFGGWKVTFTLGYSVPLEDFMFKSSDGRRFLNITFGSSFGHVVVDNLIVKVVLPEGSTQPTISVPFAVEQDKEIKHTYLDTVGRPVVVLTKKNAVPEHHNIFFQVYYRFNSIAMLAEPLLLVTGFFAFFVLCIAYVHFDFPISKSSASFQAQVQREELVDLVQRLQKVIGIRGEAADRLEASLRDVARSGDTAPCKVARKTADATWKETSKDLKALSESFHLSARSSFVLPKVEVLLQKEKEMVEKLQQKQVATVEAYERKLSSKDIDARIAPLQSKYSTLKQEVRDLIYALDD